MDKVLVAVFDSEKQARKAADVIQLKARREFVADVERTLEPGKTALLAEINEEETGPLDRQLAPLGGVVFRRPVSGLTVSEPDDLLPD